MVDKLIFVSCGQQTDDEKKLGTAVKQLIDSKSGYKAYFAEYVQSLDGLSKNVFDGLRKCSGLISFLHERGFVKRGEESWGYRSSVWVNQEIAILAYRRQFEGVEIPILIFKDDKVRLEGAMTSLIVNPRPMKSESEILAEIDSWMNTTHFPSNASVGDDRFLSKWQKLSPVSIQVLSALIAEGGTNVKETAIRICLREKYGFNKNDASNAIMNAKLEFIKTDLVKLTHNIHSGDEMSVNANWVWHINREINKMRKEVG
jgi:hypothetical protein